MWCSCMYKLDTIVDMNIQMVKTRSKTAPFVFFLGVNSDSSITQTGTIFTAGLNQKH